MLKEYISYLKNNPEHYWFKRKLYGWGWTPATKEGWLVIITYAVLIVALALIIDNNSSIREIVYIFMLPVFLLTLSVIGICYKKGERPRWQWGGKNVSKNNKNLF